MLAANRNIAGATIRGVLPEEERRATGLGDRLRSGRLEDLQPGSYRIILGSALARELNVGVGGSVIVIAARGHVRRPPGSCPRMRRFQVTRHLPVGHVRI